jgi:Leucine-rich repeat (LRR) protein
MKRGSIMRDNALMVSRQSLLVSIMSIFLLQFVLLGRLVAINSLPSRLETSTTSISCNISADEFAGLQALYKSCNGDSWHWDHSISSDTIWTFPSSLSAPCGNSWQRVACELVGPDQCQITSLSLGSFGLMGSLPTEIGYLSGLTYFNASTNSLMSALPPAVGSMAVLRTLALDFNTLSSSIPDSIGLLIELEYLYLNNNSLTGQLPSAVGALLNLQELVITNNHIEGSLPIEFGNLTSLQLLEVADNRFYGCVDGVLGSLVSLTDLDLQANYFQCEFPNLGLLPNITRVYLDSNAFIGSLPTSLCSATKLVWLSMEANKLFSSLPSCLGQLVALEDLNLFFNGFESSLPTEIGLMTSLINLKIGENSLEGQIPTQIGNLIQLENFNADQNRFKSTIPSEVGNLVRLFQFQIPDNQFYGSIPSSMGNLSNLVILELNSNRLTGELPTELGLLSNVEIFFLSYNSLRGSLPTQLGQLTKITQFNANVNSLSGQIPTELGNWLQVIDLDLASIPLQGTLPTELCRLTTVKNLYINFNQLHGTFPACMGNMTALTAVQMCCNDITGSLPPSLAQLRSLESFNVQQTSIHGTIPEFLSSWPLLVELYLQDTLISGSIPASVTNLTKLGVLDLSNTFISGTLPRLLGDLIKLQYLNLSFTNLEGALPASIVKLQRMKVLVFNNNHFTSHLPLDLGLNEGLEYFSIAFNYLTGPVPDDIVIAQTLTEFNTGFNFLNGSVPFRRGMSKDMIYIVLSTNLFTGQLPRNWSEFKDLQFVYVDNNELTGPLPDISVADVSKYASSSLLQFYASNNKLSGTIPSALWEHTNLQVLSLASNRLSGSLTSELNNLRGIESLDLSTNRFSGDLFAAFATPFPNLTFVNMANNSFANNIPNNVFVSSSLQVVTLNSNCFSGSLPTTICNSSKLTSLIMDAMSSGSSCAVALPRKLSTVIKGVFPEKKIVDSIPECLFQLPFLTTLQMSGNGLKGTIPSVAPPLVLTNLQLSYNAITGTISESLQMRGGFQFLSLQHNKLEGTLVSNFNTTTSSSADNDDNSNSNSGLSIYLDVNRLSGNVPETFYSVPTVSVLTGNLFECIGSSTLPLNDPSRDTYVCGSFQLNTALYVWLAVVLAVLLVVSVCYALLLYFTLINPNNIFAVGPNTNDSNGGETTQGIGSQHSASQLTIELRPSMSFNQRARSGTPFDRESSDTGSAADVSFADDSNNGSFNRPNSARKKALYYGCCAKSSLSRLVCSGLCCNDCGGRLRPLALQICDIYSNTLMWSSFHYSSRRNLLSNTAQYTDVLKRAGEGIMAIAASYMICMVTYIILKTNAFGGSDGGYGTITFQYGWVITATFMHGLVPTLLLLVFVVLTTFGVIASLKIDALQSAANKRSMQRELWKHTLRYSRSNAILNRLVDQFVWPFWYHFVNLVVTLTANAVYVTVLLTVNSEAVFFVQASMSLFKLGWANFYVPIVVQRMNYMPATAQFRHQVFMLLVNYIIGPGVASAGANSNCFYPAIMGSPTITSSFTTFNTELSCFTIFNFFYTQAGLDVSKSTDVCSFKTTMSTANSATVPPFIYGYQCGSSFLVDYIPVLLYSYLFSAVMLPIWRFFILHIGEANLKEKYLGERLYKLLLAGSIMDCDGCIEDSIGSDSTVTPTTNRSESGPDIGSLAAAMGSSNDSVSNPLQERPSRKTETDHSKSLSERGKYEKSLFDGHLVMAKRILDFAVTMTFGLACPLLALAIAFSVYINSFCWRLMIGKFLSKVGDNNLVAFSRLEHSTEGLLRGAVGGMWIAVFAISLFWSVMFYDMIADQFGHIVGTYFALLTIFCIPLFLYIVFVIRAHLSEKQARERLDEKDPYRDGRIRSQMSEGIDIWSVNKLNNPSEPTVEQNSVFI